MTRPLIQIGDDVRQMTDAEFAQWQKDVAEDSANAQVLIDKTNARIAALAKLEALGLTPTEIAALVG